MQNFRPIQKFGRRLAPALSRALLMACSISAGAAPSIRLNTVGFLPDRPKQATIALVCTNFAIVRVGDGKAVYRGVVTGPRVNADTGEELFLADFTAVRESGSFQIDVAGVGRSAPFRIAANVYNDAFRTVTRGMYLWRCGASVAGERDGQTFAHAVCHTNDAWLDFVGGGHTARDSTRGWHDAGDYNKYVVNAGVTVGCMFRAWDDFRPQLEKVRLDLPESGGKTPDFLAEIKWELDWLLTMQATDGSVYHKVSTARFGPFIAPEAERTDRFFTPWSSAATADFVALLAQAARYFHEFDPAFAAQCQKAADRSYQFLADHPEDHLADLTGFSTGGYQTGDQDDRLWASAEIWETTGSAAALRDLENRLRAQEPKIELNWDWGNVGNLGALTYLFSPRPGRDAELVSQLRKLLLATADGIVKTRDEHGYARPLGTTYYWGCNGGVARQVVLLQAAHRLNPNPRYLEVALDAVSHLFGRNVYGRSFVTGVGAEPPLHPHDRRSGKDGPAWPGYLVGGANPKATDWHDTQADYRTNEIAINWNGALIYALAGFIADP